MTKSFQFTNQRVVIIGGSSGLGLATAQLVSELGGDVVIVGRSEDKLLQAKQQINSKTVEHYVLDNKNENELKDFFEQLGEFDHLFTPGASYKRGPITASMETARSCFVSSPNQRELPIFHSASIRQ